MMADASLRSLRVRGSMAAEGDTDVTMGNVDAALVLMGINHDKARAARKVRRVFSFVMIEYREE